MMHEVNTYYSINSIAGVSVQEFVINDLRLLGGPPFAGGHDPRTTHKQPIFLDDNYLSDEN